VARIESSVARVVRGKPEAIRLAVTTLLARGHLLIEDVPGVGKTTLARALARSIGGVFHRIQFTSDLLPSDILGVSVFDATAGKFNFRPGPIFANVVLADEINRTPPRTQSSLLEAMNDRQVSLDDKTYSLPSPFFVLATQNPQEHYGTYPLPESQMDRFLLRIRLGYPPPSDERALLLDPGALDPVDPLEPATTLAELQGLQELAEKVRLEPTLVDYAMAVIHETRTSPLVALGISTRGALAWCRAAQAHALASGRSFCVPDDFRELAVPALAHRLVLAGVGDSGSGSAREDVERTVRELLERVPAPV
jgi:MoxR-like ATPase